MAAKFYGPRLVLQHAALETRRAEGDAAAAFWRLLGFYEVEPPASLRDRAAWLQRGATQIHLLWTDEPVAAPEGHVAVVVDDYEATLARLREQGHEVKERPQHWGVPRAFARSPGGHRVELMSAPPPGGSGPAPSTPE
jgi:catechol 2,3-dioxygenase-like lactoylglutathione lyase family enzyme